MLVTTIVGTVQAYASAQNRFAYTHQTIVPVTKGIEEAHRRKQ